MKYKEVMAKYRLVCAESPTFYTASQGYYQLDKDVQDLKTAILHGTKEEVRNQIIRIAAMALRVVTDLRGLYKPQESTDIADAENKDAK